MRATVYRPLQPRRVWWTARGAWGNARRIVDRSPHVRGWVMITLTLDPSRFSGPKEAYEAACADFPRFNRSLAGLHGGKLRWARKMELHESGWPHWHLICNLRKLRREELHDVTRIWGHGHTQVDFIRDSRHLQYVLKYCVKAAAGEDTLPDWILDFPRRIRWWQTHEFYEVKAPSVPQKERKEEPENHEYATIRDRISWHSDKLEVIEYDRFDDKPEKRYIFSLDGNKSVDYVHGVIKRDYIPGVIPERITKAGSIVTKVKTCPTTKTFPGAVFFALAP